jgi:hypothetical protein
MENKKISKNINNTQDEQISPQEQRIKNIHDRIWKVYATLFVCSIIAVPLFNLIDFVGYFIGFFFSSFVVVITSFPIYWKIHKKPIPKWYFQNTNQHNQWESHWNKNKGFGTSNSSNYYYYYRNNRIK